MLSTPTLSKFLLAVAVITSGLAIAGPAEDRVTKAFTAFNTAFNKGDAKAVAAFYTPDAVVLPPSHDVINTPADIEKFIAGLFSNHVTGHVLQPFKIIETGNTIIVASKWSAKAQDDKGATTNIGGIATHVFQKQSNNTYKLKLHTFN